MKTITFNQEAQQIFNELRLDRFTTASKLVHNPEAYRETKNAAGCWYDSARGWTILPNVVFTALNAGFDWGEEIDKRYAEFLDREETSTYHTAQEDFWLELEAPDSGTEPMYIFEESESYLNTHVAPKGYYFSLHEDWGDWGLYKSGYTDEEKEEIEYLATELAEFDTDGKD